MHAPHFSSVSRIICVAIPLAMTGCIDRSDRDLVVYCALDREFSEPVLIDFQQETDIRILAKYDIESTKTVGLVTEIIQERNRPRCDLFWNNEILHTIRLERLGLLEAYRSPQAEFFPENYRSADGYWYALAARARILIVNTDLIRNRADRPSSVDDLTLPKWKHKAAIAKPLFGTTATHAATLFATLGPDKAQAFFESVQDNVDVLSGNKQVAQAVARGQYAFGLTDTDDAIIEIDHGNPVAIIFPDQGPQQPGTLFIPNTICLIKGTQNYDNATQLLDDLLTRKVEEQLATGRSAQFPLHVEAVARSRVETPEDIKWMNVDFEASATSWDEWSPWLKELFYTDE